MGPESTSASTSTPSPPPTSGKRCRDPEDEVYVDNLHSHKRYLSEIMASSLNGLTVGDSLPDNLMDSPARSESMFYSRDDLSLQYSPMSEDSSDDSRFCETNNCSSQPESLTTSPVSSPHRYQRPLSSFSYTPSTSSFPSYGSNINTSTCSQSLSRQRGSETEGRFPSSPSDICHSADLRRAALLRSVQLRTQPSTSLPFDLPFGLGQESVSDIEVEVEERPCSFVKTLGEDRGEYHVEEGPSLGITEPEPDDKSSNELKYKYEGG